MSDIDAADALVETAMALRQAGDIDQAVALCDRALQASPAHPRALHLRGVMALAQGRADAAVELIGRAVAANPGDLRGHADLGVALARAGRPEDALAVYGRVLALQPDNAGVQVNRANLLASLGRIEDALAAYEAATTADPDHLQAWANRGATLQEAGRLEEALVAFAEVVRLDPKLPAAHVRTAAVLLALKRPQAALAACGRALTLDSGDVGVWSNRGAALLALNRPHQALAALDQAVRLDPAFAPGHANRGAALRELNRLDEAMESFGRALALAPHSLEARCNLGVCQLLAGDFGPGFEGHEQRWRIEPGLTDRRDFSAPLWLGDEDVAGKTVLLHAEQGFGDTLNFCRYATLLAARGARVVLEAPPALTPLLAGLEGVAQLVARGESLPAFDYHCPLMSLPLAFGTRLDTIPASAAYLAAPAERTAAWAARIGPAAAVRVGVVWSGKPTHHNDHNRSIPLRRFLRALPEGIEVFSLHDRVRDADAAVLADHPHIWRFDGQIGDFADTAALAAAMDLVISVDTSAAHLAAALGRPTWVLLPFAPDWRWLLEREDSPWYPTVRLFRQPTLGDWDTVLDRVRVALERLAAGASPA
jgi:tetratricopeptide (TPR) repeat protein